MSPHPALPGAPLRLRFLASGATQHVFVRMDDPTDGWVYKTPAVWDALLPGPVEVGRVAPQGGGKRLLYSLLYRVPRGLWRRLGADGRPAARAARLLGGRLAAGYLALANRVLSLHLRRSRVAAFRRMLRIHRVLAGDGLGAGVVLPWVELPDARATLHVAGEERRYRGPILAQRRAEVFFECCEGVERFDWGRLVHVQHRLWRHGVALADAAGALGPQGWALLDDRLLLADTGSLTEDFGLAARVLSPEILDGHERWHLHHRTDPASGERARAYFRLVRAQIDRERLAELWCADLPGRRVGKRARGTGRGTSEEAGAGRPGW